MPNDTAFSARFLEYSKILTKLTGKRNNDQKYLVFINTLRSLSDKLNELSVNDKRLSSEEINDLIQLYLNARNATNAYLQQEDPSSLDRQRMYVAKHFTTLLGKDLNALFAADRAPGVTIQDLFRHSRMAHLDISGSIQSKTGNACSNRLPVSYQSEDGVIHRGFFTKEIIIREHNYQIAYEQLYSFKDSYPAYADVWNAMIDQEETQLSYLARRVAGYSEEPTAPFLGGENDPFRGYLSQERYQQLQADEDFRQIAAEFERRLISSVKSSAALRNNIRGQAGSSITDRNCAMTAAAKLLNRPDLVARSERAVIYQNGVRAEGCIMYSATGTDLDNLQPDDLAFEWAKQADQRSHGPLVSGECLRQMADLQILDFLCGNVDRHSRNMFYQYKKNANGNVELAGVMGIDNDYSFGTVKMEDGMMHSAGLNNLGFISRSMAERIVSITPDMLEFTLADMMFTLNEKRAVAQRLTQLQQAIAKEHNIAAKADHTTKVEEGRLQIIEDEDFQKLNIKQMEYNTSKGHNIFAVVGMGAPHVIQEYVKGEAAFVPNKVLYTGAVEGVPTSVTSTFVVDRLSLIAITMDRFAEDAKWNSTEFKAMHTALKHLRRDANQENLQELCRTLEQSTASYITLKKGVPTTLRGKRRLDLARELREVIGDICKDITDTKMAGPHVKVQTFREKCSTQINDALKESKAALRQAVANGQWEEATRETSKLAYLKLTAGNLDLPGNGKVLDMLSPRNLEKGSASLDRFSKAMIDEMGKEEFYKLTQNEDCDTMIYDWNIDRVQKKKIASHKKDHVSLIEKSSTDPMKSVKATQP